MADVGGAVDQGGAAVEAVLRVGRGGQPLAGDGGIVDPEAKSALATARESGEERVVHVDDGLRALRQRRDGGPPALGDELELPVAVELVAEEVPEADGPRRELPRDLRESGLVDLEQGELCPARL